MRAKHWAYMGLVFVMGNATQLPVSTAADLGRFTDIRSLESPAFAPLLSLGTEKLLFKPHESHPVTIRLFASYPVHALWIKSPSLFIADKHKVQGPLYIFPDQGLLCFHPEKGRDRWVKEITIKTVEEDMGMVVRTDRHGSKMTLGTLLVRLNKGKIEVINMLDLEDYLEGVLEPELGSLKLSPEVLKAQIVAARSYVLAMKGEQHRGQGYDFCDSPHCQVFGGVPAHNPKFDAMLQAVRGKYLSYQGRPVAAFYHHDCGGATSAVQDVWVAPARPYLRSVEEPADSICRTKKSEWHFRPSKRSLTACFRSAGWLGRHDGLVDLVIPIKDVAGRAKTIQIQSRKAITVPVGHFRNVVNQYYGKEVLKSALFTIDLDGNRVVFHGRGWGHGVGLCQEGAMDMARHGKSYRHILSHYFPRTKISQLP